MQLPPFWQVTPIGLMVVVVALVHEMGLRWLALRQTPAHRAATQAQELGLLRWTARVVPGGVGPAGALGHGVAERAHGAARARDVLPPATPDHRRPLGPAGLCPPRRPAPPAPARLVPITVVGAGPWAYRLVTRPVAAVILFNGVMVLWHLPVVFDWASDHDWAMNWLMAPSFVVVGILFWRIILPSHPWAPRGSTRMQVGAVVVTAFEMLVLAMAMAIFSKAPWYSMNVLMDGACRRAARPALRGGHPLGVR